MMQPSALIWFCFIAFVLAVVALDLGLFQKQRGAVPLKEALWKTAGYIILALIFAGGLFVFAGHKPGMEFLTGYFLEYALSMDNIMVFILILAHFQVPPEYQRRVLQWGIIGALILRGVFIFAGLALLQAFEWVVIIFGLLLIYTGYRNLRETNEDPDIGQNFVVRWIRRLLPVSASYDKEKFITRSSGKLQATPLLLVLVILNVIDIVFAVDSIPAIFAITRDQFIVFTSNVFAILGLRALYFALAGLLDRFKYLKIGLALTLIFIGIKMIYNYLPWEDIPIEASLIITAALIFGSIIYSLIRTRVDAKNT